LDELKAEIAELEKATPIIVHSLLPTPYSPSYYNLKGTPLGTIKPATPGVYIEKQGTQTRRIVVR
ncbi:MAG: hypothetical protein FWH22_11570, partial [Fibromonadales bacterium]|nr:hypothetical protein [Fibromonadales bacterium]